MLVIPGPPALSAFRIAKLLARLQALQPDVRALDARFVHFADLAAPLSAEEHAVLTQLLTYGPSLPSAAAAGGCTSLFERVDLHPQFSSYLRWIKNHRAGGRAGLYG